MPCWEFRNPVLAERMIDLQRGLRQGERQYCPYREADRTYVANPVDMGAGEWPYRFRTDQMVDLQFRSDWVCLRSARQKMPAGARHIILLAAGKAYWRFQPTINWAGTPWDYAINYVIREAYVAWDASTKVSLPEGGLAYAARTARGVVYSERMMFDKNGLPSYVLVTVDFVTVRVADSKAGSDDMLHVRRYRRATWVNTLGYPDRCAEDRLIGLSNVWRELYEEAVIGFGRDCNSVGLSSNLDGPRHDREDIQEFLTQAKNLREDRSNTGRGSFHRRIQEMNAREAIWMVQQPWQMVLFLEHHLSGTNQHQRLQQMTKPNRCTPERRAELLSWFAFARRLVQFKPMLKVLA